MLKAGKFYFTNLSNGLRVLLLPSKEVLSFKVLVLINTGADFEIKEQNGISHLLEHMYFKGTPKRPSTFKIATEIDSVGGYYNAYTDREITGLFIQLGADYTDLALDVSSDILLHPLLPEKELEKEKGVIIEEINMLADDPRVTAYELWEKLLYGNQPAGWPIGGSKETVARLSRDDLQQYWQSQFRSQSVLVALSGKLPSSETKALALVKKYFHNIPLGQGKPKLKTREKQIKPNLLIQKKSTEQTHLWLGFRAFNTFDPRQYALEVLNAVLDAGMSSRLFQLLREKLGLAYYVNSWFSLKTDTGWWAVSAGVNNDRVLEAISHILKEFRSFKISRLDEAEVKKAKNCLIGRLSLSSENVHAVAADYASQALLKNQIISLEEHLKKIKDVRFSEVKKLAEELIKPQFLNLALLGPIKEDQKIKKLLRSFIN